MNVQQAYNAWSETYDTVENKTRDLEARAIRVSVAGSDLDILEIGCGTGKNTEYLQTIAKSVTAVDFSEDMLVMASMKNWAGNVAFQRLDLRENWNLPDGSYDLITCSLALEHIENIDFVFSEANRVLRTGGRFYFGELHPFKQYQGSKARFETGAGVFELECFVHHVAEFFAAAANNNFAVAELHEWFDDGDKAQIPRLLTMILTKQ